MAARPDGNGRRTKDKPKAFGGLIYEGKWSPYWTHPGWDLWAKAAGEDKYKLPM
jgi:hypothetical protein